MHTELDMHTEAEWKALAEDTKRANAATAAKRKSAPKSSITNGPPPRPAPKRPALSEAAANTLRRNLVKTIRDVAQAHPGGPLKYYKANPDKREAMRNAANVLAGRGHLVSQ